MRYAKKAFIITFVIILAAIIGLSYWLLVVSPYDLPKGPLIFSRLKPPSSSVLLDRTGAGIVYYSKNEPVAFYKPLDQIDKKLRDWVVMLEDAKFFSHKGFDVGEIQNSFWQNFKAGKVKRGGSGITQQLAKNLFLDRRRSYTRKLYEVPWTLKLESSLSKRQILELYLNSIEWGPGLAGAEAASRYFFGKSCSNLTVGEAMYLALIIPSPSRFNLIKNPGAQKSLETKRRWFVNRLVNEKKIQPSEKSDYMSASFNIKSYDDPERLYPAPIASSFKFPDWAEFLKPYSKGRNASVSIVKKIQLSGLESQNWLSADSLQDGSLLPASTTWCGFLNGSVASYWMHNEVVSPSENFVNSLLEAGVEIRSCEGLNTSEAFKL